MRTDNYVSTHTGGHYVTQLADLFMFLLTTYD